jgi:hypothetical protein
VKELGDALVAGTVNAVLAAISFALEVARPVLADTKGPKPTLAEIGSAAIDQIAGKAKRSGRAATKPGAVMEADVLRLKRYVDQVVRGSLVDIQSKTLTESFVVAVEGSIQDAALENWSREKFLARMDALAARFGETAYRGSYAETWFDTIVLNTSYNLALDKCFTAAPTKKLFPFFAFRTDGGPNVRASHDALNGFVAPVDWPGWDDYSPPLDWGCHCRKVPVSHLIAAALGWIGKEFPLGVDFLKPRKVGGEYVVPGRAPDFDVPLTISG